MEMLDEKEPADLIWDQIQIQYAAIIKAQKIMFVTSKSEMIKELKKSEYELVPDSDKKLKQIATLEEYEFQFSWDRQSTFLNAQSGVMCELRSLIKQFIELSHEDDERRRKHKQIQVSIERQKHDMSIKGKELDLKDKEVANKRVLHQRNQILILILKH